MDTPIIWSWAGNELEITYTQEGPVHIELARALLRQIARTPRRAPADTQDA